MTTYNAPEQQYEKENTGQVKAVVIPYAGVFFYLALGMAIVAALGFFWPNLLNAMAGNDEYSFYIGDIVSTVISALGVLVLSFVLSIKAFSKKTLSMLIFFLLDAVFWGVLFSSIVSFAVAYEAIVNHDFTGGYGIVGMAFAIVAGVMLLTGIIGFVFKNSWKLSTFIGIGLLGVLALALVNIFLFDNLIAWIIDMLLLFIIVIETIVDMNRIKRMARGGWLAGNNNLTIFCAYTLMSDYVMLLIRIIPYLLLFSNRRK